MAKGATAGKLKVRLIVDMHIDAGTLYRLGEELEVDSTTAAWLIENKIAEMV